MIYYFIHYAIAIGNVVCESDKAVQCPRYNGLNLIGNLWNGSFILLII